MVLDGNGSPSTFVNVSPLAFRFVVAPVTYLQRSSVTFFLGGRIMGFHRALPSSIAHSLNISFDHRGLTVVHRLDSSRRNRGFVVGTEDHDVWKRALL